MNFVVPVYVHRKIHPEIVRDAVSIPVRVEDALPTRVIISSYGKGNGTPGTIDYIGGNTKAMGYFQIADQADIMGLIIIAWIILSPIDKLTCYRIIRL